MTKTIVLIAALFTASPSMLFAQTVQPAEHQTQTVPTEHQTQTVQPTEHQTGIIDTELQEADSIHCAVVREDLRNDKGAGATVTALGSRLN